MSSLKSKLESILFLAGEPMTVLKLSKVVKVKPAEIKAALTELENDYQERGLRLLNNNEEWQFGTAPENAAALADLAKSEFSEELSRAALETLSVIAYKGPMTRAEIEYIRGVNSSFTIHNLLLRGLVERVENPKDARSYLYHVSLDFLKYLGLPNRESLPEWGTLREAVIPTAEETAKIEKNQEV